MANIEERLRALFAFAAELRLPMENKDTLQQILYLLPFRSLDSCLKFDFLSLTINCDMIV